MGRDGLAKQMNFEIQRLTSPKFNLDACELDHPRPLFGGI